MPSSFISIMRLALALVLAGSLAASAQLPGGGTGGPPSPQTPGGGGTGGPPAPNAAPTQTPLDGGASLLLAGGIGYAVRRLRQRRRA